MTVTAGVPEELGARLLRAAGASVTGVDIEMIKADAGELTAETAAARIEVGGRAGSRQVTARLGFGLALAAVTGAPVRLARRGAGPAGRSRARGRPGRPDSGPAATRPAVDGAPRPGGRGRSRRGNPRGRSRHRNPCAGPASSRATCQFADGLDRWEPRHRLCLTRPRQPGERDLRVRSRRRFRDPVGGRAAARRVSSAGADDLRR